MADVLPTAHSGYFIVEEVVQFLKHLEEWAQPLADVGFSIRALKLDGAHWVKWPRPRLTRKQTGGFQSIIGIADIATLLLGSSTL